MKKKFFLKVQCPREPFVKKLQQQKVKTVISL